MTNEDYYTMFAAMFEDLAHSKKSGAYSSR